VERQLRAGTVSVVRGGKALLRQRNNLAAAGLTAGEWRREWEASRLFLTADGEKDKAWGNETIRWNPDAGWLEIKLPAPLTHLANQSHGRYRLSSAVEFGYRGDEVMAQASAGAIRYDITRNPATPRGPRQSPGKRPHGLTGPRQATRQPTTVRGRRLQDHVLAAQ
jgi:hypothetical protein